MIAPGGDPSLAERIDPALLPLLTYSCRIGELYRAGRTRWPVGARYHFGAAGHELTLFWPEVSEEVRRAVGREPAEFALILEPPLIVFAYRFGSVIPWGDAPYAWPLSADEPRVIPPLERAAEARALLRLRLVGADDGIIHAERGVTLSPAFTRALNAAIRAQAQAPFDPYAYTRAVAAIYLGQDAPADLWRRAVARTGSNE
ncbi:MAG: hypothetical protein IRY99_22935 [Isosphaeraceae bacterium]|nr:hypothetical protein [Isosphaeraceae bacterium]